MSEVLKQAVRVYADGHARADGFVPTPIPGLVLMRHAAPSGIMHALYRPLLCLVLDGAKQVTVGRETHTFGEGQSLIVSADLAAVGRVVRASRQRPYLSLAVDLDMAMMRDVAAEIAATHDGSTARQGTSVFVDDTEDEVADGALRLMRLLDRPAAVPVLRPVIVKELHYWLLCGRHGPAIRDLARPDGRAERIARAVAILRADYAGPIPVERLAAAARMSLSSFHQHFKAVTSLSPIQFQKRLRLLEARRLMLDESQRACDAAFSVGYESASQFTRDYGRMFGVSPRRDAGEARAAA